MDFFTDLHLWTVIATGATSAGVALSWVKSSKLKKSKTGFNHSGNGVCVVCGRKGMMFDERIYGWVCEHHSESGGRGAQPKGAFSKQRRYPDTEDFDNELDLDGEEWDEEEEWEDIDRHQGDRQRVQQLPLPQQARRRDEQLPAYSRQPQINMYPAPRARNLPPAPLHQRPPVRNQTQKRWPMNCKCPECGQAADLIDRSPVYECDCGYCFALRNEGGRLVVREVC